MVLLVGTDLDDMQLLGRVHGVGDDGVADDLVLERLGLAKPATRNAVAADTADDQQDCSGGGIAQY